MNKYQQGKEKAITAAQEWQIEAGQSVMSYAELNDDYNRLYKLAKRFGLVREFRENGIV